MTAHEHAGSTHAHNFVHIHDRSGTYSATYTIEVEDGDGIADAVDTQPLAPSNDFSDGTTTGTITNRGNQELTVTDAADPTLGVEIAASAAGGAIPATVSACRGVSSFDLGAGDSVSVICSSVTIDVISGTVDVTFIAPDGTETTASLGAGNSLTLETETFTISAPESNLDDVVIVVNDVSITVTPGATAVSIDTTAPTVTPPADQTAEATGDKGAAVSYPDATAADAVGIVSGPGCTPASGSIFAIGTTTVTCTASDAAGNEGSASFDITVQDTTPPTLTMPPDAVNEATSSGGAVHTFSATAADIADPSPTVVCTPPSGSTFPVGTVSPGETVVTTVNCTATDATGNSTGGSFTKTVVDTTAPSITAPPDMTVLANNPGGWSGSIGTPTVSDIVDPSPAVTSDAPTVFPLGDTTVVWKAEDAIGNSATDTHVITVLGARALKLSALEDLEAITSLNEMGQVKLDEALAYLGQALFGGIGDAETPWVDETHLSPVSGPNVFATQNDALEKLIEILQKSDEFGASASVVAEIRDIIENKILLADRLLAQVAIDESSSGDPVLLAEANVQMDNAQDATAAGEYDKAVENYFKAWEAALKAIGVI